MKTNNERFWAKVEKSEAGCWLWTAGRRRAGGHGVFVKYDAEAGKHKPVDAHRYVMEILGEIPVKGAIIKHTCGNVACVNPAHLIVPSQATPKRPVRGTLEDRNLGELNPRAVLKDGDATFIRMLYKRGKSVARLAVLFSVHEQTIYKILRNERRKTTREAAQLKVIEGAIAS